MGNPASLSYMKNLIIFCDIERWLMKVFRLGLGEGEKTGSLWLLKKLGEKWREPELSGNEESRQQSQETFQRYNGLNSVSHWRHLGIAIKGTYLDLAIGGFNSRYTHIQLSGYFIIFCLLHLLAMLTNHFSSREVFLSNRNLEIRFL